MAVKALNTLQLRIFHQTNVLRVACLAIMRNFSEMSCLRCSYQLKKKKKTSTKKHKYLELLFVLVNNNFSQMKMNKQASP